MKSLIAALAALLLPALALAALPVGSKAPAFTAQATLAGKSFAFDLTESLKKGPVVLYFYPAAFTPGCTVEAHLFAESMEKFQALGATVIGMSGDDLDKLAKFSVSECRSKFAVAADPGLRIATQYDALLASHPGYSSRTSYVIAPDGSILAALDEMKPEPHIEQALATLKKWQDAKK
jgi:peroxiredoxin Q/BCP